MRKLLLLIAATLLASSVPTMAQENESREHSAMQHYGGHGRHMHRDWSNAYGRGHVHSVCWQWDNFEGWRWVCR